MYKNYNGINILFPINTNFELVEKSSLLTNWSKNIDKKLKIINCEVLSIDFFTKVHIGFFELNIKYEYNNEIFNEIIFLTGKSVSIVPLFKSKEDSKIYTILVEQPRIDLGTIVYEFTAGMVDDTEDY